MRVLLDVKRVLPGKYVSGSLPLGHKVYVKVTVIIHS